MAASRKLYVSILFLVFLYNVYNSYNQVLMERTTFQESTERNSVTLPSITFCERNPQMDDFKTFDEVLEAINETKTDHYNCTLKHKGLGVNQTAANLKNATILAKKFNVTLNDVWSHAPTLQFYQPHGFIICTTLNLHFITIPPKKGQFWIELETQNFKGVYFEKHEIFQSEYNFNENPLETIDFLANFEAYSGILIPTKTSKIKTRNYDCYEDNAMSRTNCINDFVEEELNCTLPWNEQGSKCYEQCEGEAKLWRFRKIMINISSDDETQTKIRDKGCLKPNCITTTFKKLKDEDFYCGKNRTCFNLIVPSNSYRIIREEILLKDFGTLLADCGSYIGLFLGASILSLTDQLISYLKLIYRTIQRKMQFIKTTKKMDLP